ncbi:MAG: glycoside hydrolase family 4 [Opitutales bacterium]
MSASKSPKLVLIGAGSLFFGHKLIWALNHLDGLKDADLALVDTDPEHLATMVQLAETVRLPGAGYTVTGHADFREALPDADFVVLSFSHQNAHYRKVDCEASERFGFRMCSGDTIGPGGLFRAMRELPKILEIADAVAEICPDAWLINYINPSAVNGIALQLHGKTRNFALCDSLHLPYLKHNYMKQIGLDPADIDDFDMKIAGVNHFTWMLSCTFRGEDMMPRIREKMISLSGADADSGHSKARFNNTIAVQLWDIYGACPVCVGHTKEYVPFYQGRGTVPEAVPPLAIFDGDERKEKTDQHWVRLRAWAFGETDAESFHTDLGSDHATDIIQAIWNDSGRHFFVNTPNQGAVPNLPDDAFLELECRVDAQGVHPVPVGPFPLGLRSEQLRILDNHELIARGILERDTDLLRRALAVDPLTVSIGEADAVFDALYEAENEVTGPYPPRTDSLAGRPTFAPEDTGEGFAQGVTGVGRESTR